MNIILLSGGSGKRLWPLSNDIRSKQFIKIFKNDVTGEYESMVQRVFRQIKKIDSEANVTVATSKTQISELHNQVGEDVNISVEPCRRDTFPAVALATAYLKDIEGVSEDDVVVVCPVDPLVDDDYFEALKKLSDIAAKGDANLVVMGIEPTYPSEKYGYVIPTTKDNISTVSTFKEKPTTEVAQQYIDQGALWNAGVFAYKIGYVLKKAHELMDFTDYNDLFSKYDTVKKISFDYAVAEHESKIQVLRFGGRWTDLGTWNTLTEAMEDKAIGNVVSNQECENLAVINSLDMPVLCMGLKNIIVAASPEGILVTTPSESSYIKPFVDKFDSAIKFAEKSWGNYQVIDVNDDSMTVKVTLKQGHQMSYHSHEHREEVWTIVSGNGIVILNGDKKQVNSGDVITLPIGTKHTIIANTDLVLIEVQLGKNISVEDKMKYELN